MSIAYFDAHCDTSIWVHYMEGTLYKNPYHVDLERLSAYAPCAQVFAVCVKHKPGMVEQTELVIDSLRAALEEYAHCVRLCCSGAEIRSAQAAGKIAAILSVEGMEKLDCSLEKLRAAYDKGVRMVNLVWNHDNALTGAAMDSGAGLSEAGRAFVHGAQEMGVILDMSHISEKAFWDCMEEAKKPLIASHSNSYALCPAYPRNLTDEQFKALAACGGVVGLNLYPEFLGLGRNIDAVISHAEHFLALGGEKVLCLGGDLDGIDVMPEGIKGVESMGNLYEAMLKRNWSESLVRDIFFNNLMDFMEKSL